MENRLAGRNPLGARTAAKESMDKRGSGSHEMDASRRRGATRKALARALGDLPFPMSKQELLTRVGDCQVVMGDAGQTVRLEDILANVNTVEFASPDHVTEVMDIDWNDMADILDPGGTGSHTPWHLGRPGPRPPE